MLVWQGQERDEGRNEGRKEGQPLWPLLWSERRRRRRRKKWEIKSSGYSFSRLRPIQQFWFGEPDTEPNWLVREVWPDTLCRYILTFRLGMIQQFWFAEQDTEPIGVVCLVRHHTLQQYILTLLLLPLLLLLPPCKHPPGKVRAAFALIPPSFHPSKQSTFFNQKDTQTENEREL